MATPQSGSHHRSWSTDLSKPSTTGVIIVKKSKKEPEPPQRNVSLPPVTHPSSNRYSCPTFRIHPSSSSIPPSSSSPPSIQTSTITGPDPSGWKLHRISGNTSPRSPSLQIPLSDIFPAKKSPLRPSKSNPSESKAPKVSCRRNSDSLAFLRSLGTALPVTREELCATQLRHVKNTSNSDEVFCEENAEKCKQKAKEPPPVPFKSEKAKQIAQLIAFSRQLSIESKEEIPNSND